MKTTPIEPTRTRMERAKGYDPDPMDLPPLFQSPAKPVAMLRWLVTKYLWPQSLTWIALAALIYQLFTPGLSRFGSLSVDDVALLWLRNTVLMLVVIGGQHWWLHIRRSQGTEFKYERRWLAKNRSSFLFNNQTRDNMFWTCCCCRSTNGLAHSMTAVLKRTNV